MSDQDELCTTCKHKKRDHYSGISGCLVTTCRCTKFTHYTWAQTIAKMPRAPIINDDCDRPEQWSREKLVGFVHQTTAIIKRTFVRIERELSVLDASNDWGKGYSDAMNNIRAEIEEVLPHETPNV